MSCDNLDLCSYLVSFRSDVSAWIYALGLSLDHVRFSDYSLPY